MLICRVVFILLVVGLVRCVFMGWSRLGLWFAFGLAFRTSPRRVEGAGFEPAKAWPSDLQSDPFDRLGIPPKRGKSQIIAQNAPLCQVISPIFKFFFSPPAGGGQKPPSTPDKTGVSGQDCRKSGMWKKNKKARRPMPPYASRPYAGLSRSCAGRGLMLIVILNATLYNPSKGGCDEQTTELGTAKVD